jgi:hypothetical protein
MLPHVVVAVFVGVVDGKETVDEAVLDVALVATGNHAPLRGPGQYADSARKLCTPFCVVGSALITTSPVKKRWRKVVYKVRGTPSIWCGTLTWV